MTGVNWSNEEVLEQHENEVLEERAARLVNEMTAKSWLQTRLSERAKTVDIYGRDFLFRPLGTDVVTDIVERSGKLKDDENIGDVPPLFRDVRDHMADACIGSADGELEMSAEEFGMIPPKDLQEIFQEVSSADLSSEEREKAEKFRGE